MWLLQASTILWKAGLRDAPPTRNPSISFILIRSAAFPSVTEPPYKILTDYWASFDTFLPNHSLISAWVSYAISGVAVLPVPIAQTGSYAITILDQSSINSLIALNYLEFTSFVFPDSLS